MNAKLSRKPLLNVVRVERPLLNYNLLDRTVWGGWYLMKASLRKLLGQDRRLARKIIQQSEALQSLSDEDLQAQIKQLRGRLRAGLQDEQDLVASFVLVREVSGRILGMWHHHTQIRAALCLLRGEVAEMATGEGKTLAATLACATAALAGIPVHVVTVNDYLAERDGKEMQGLYEALGLSMAWIVHDMEPAERRAAYHCDITYCSNKELVFDYLKDRIVLDGISSNTALQRKLYVNPAISQQLLQRGLHFAIVDEADSIFVDEARTPLIISGEEKFGHNEEALISTAMDLAGLLEPQKDFVQYESGGVQLLPKGTEIIAEQAKVLGGLWLSQEYRESLVVQALLAYYRYKLDRDYIINEEGEVQIVDPNTGRVTPGRSWGQGLHQMIEMKEGLELTKPRETRAEISYQNFFRKYFALSGMTGTALEVRRELRNVFRVHCNVIPLLKKSQRRRAQTRVYTSLIEKYQQVTSLVCQLHKHGQPVLIGTATVVSSEALASSFAAAGLTFRVLNARQDSEEAAIVATAGQYGAITIATGMAGRGTDIKLSDESRSVGGLHVIMTEFQDASRIDRQFIGRCARQGDPGGYSIILSLQDDLLERLLQPGLRRILLPVVDLPWWRNWLGYYLFKRSQHIIEALHYKQRIRLLDSDIKRQRLLSFSGKSEYSQ